MRCLSPLLASLALLCACSREEEPVANRFDRQKAEIESKARAFEAQVENEVSAVEARLDDEADALLANQASRNAASANAAAPADSSR